MASLAVKCELYGKTVEMYIMYLAKGHTTDPHIMQKPEYGFTVGSHLLFCSLNPWTVRNPSKLQTASHLAFKTLGWIGSECLFHMWTSHLNKFCVCSPGGAEGHAHYRWPHRLLS